jgi:hypothetical protein
VVYHANYFTWFEIARIELLDQMGCPYVNLEKKIIFYLCFLALHLFIRPLFLMIACRCGEIAKVPLVELKLRYKGEKW